MLFWESFLAMSAMLGILIIWTFITTFKELENTNSSCQIFKQLKAVLYKSTKVTQTSFLLLYVIQKTDQIHRQVTNIQTVYMYNLFYIRCILFLHFQNFWYCLFHFFHCNSNLYQLKYMAWLKIWLKYYKVSRKGMYNTKWHG